MIRRTKRPKLESVGAVVSRSSVSELLSENYSDVEEVHLRHVKLEGGVLALERGVSQDGNKPGHWMMVETVWPDGRVEDPIEALTKRKLHVVDWQTDSPRLELADPKEQEKLDKRRARFAAKPPPTKPVQVIDLTNGGHEKVRKPTLGGHQPESGYRPTATDHFSPIPSRLKGKGYERQGFEATGEVRCPLRGEYYEGILGYARLSKIDFEDRVFPILRQKGAPEPVDHFGEFFPQETTPPAVQPGDLIEVAAEDVELLSDQLDLSKLRVLDVRRSRQ